MRKLSKHKKAIPVKKDLRLGRIYRTGARPACTCGVEVNGLTDAELGDLRRAYGRQVKPHHGGTSATAKLALDGDPAIRQAIAP
eukprot:5533455-Pyramimonas_sp.AAC.1